MTDRGFTLIELLVATVVVLTTAGVIASLAGPARHAFDRSAGAGEMTSAGRAGLSALVAEVRDAGSGAVLGGRLHDLSDLMPVVVPLRSLDDRRLAAPFHALAIVRATGAQGVVRDRAVEGDMSIRLDVAAPCPGQSATCGFEPGDAAAIYDTEHAESVVVGAVNSGLGILTLDRPLGFTVEGGAWVAAIERTTYGLRGAADGNSRLVRLTAGGAEQPLVDHAIELEISLWGVNGNGPLVSLAAGIVDRDLLRLRRIDLRLRVEAASSGLRGPAGPFFRRPGTATHGARWVPDIELQTAVALRR